MACVLGFQELASLNPFIRDLDEQGYQLDFINGYFLIYGLPYLDQAGSLKHGDWISPVDLTDGGALDPPKSHQAWFRGDKPHGRDGRELSIAIRSHRIEVTPALIAAFSLNFSASIINLSCVPSEILSTPSCPTIEKKSFLPSTFSNVTFTVTVSPGGVAAIWLSLTSVPTVCSFGQSK
jgi:hypothetical protein